MTNQEIEAEIQEKGLAAPRVTLEMIDSAVAETLYFTAEEGEIGRDWVRSQGEVIGSRFAGDPLSRLTFCILVLKNGYTVVGKSACVSAENFDAELGRKLARQDAIDQCWALFGFQLASEIAGVRVFDGG